MALKRSRLVVLVTAKVRSTAGECFQEFLRSLESCRSLFGAKTLQLSSPALLRGKPMPAKPENRCAVVSQSVSLQFYKDCGPTTIYSEVLSVNTQGVEDGPKYCYDINGCGVTESDGECSNADAGIPRTHAVPGVDLQDTEV
ncbi:unnamed protein product [Peronospora destructor]|uniref:Uncharacterized protein n=1 Tax=Peronospora destructor TaxID=86335 RepID=A0AAV0UR43_9STRA|nr:unnamed protein product [Peronospora destructor]